MVTTLKRQITELKGELTIYKVALGNRMLALGLKQHKMNIPKPKELKGTRSARDVDNFLYGTEQYFHAMDIEDEATKVNIVAIYFIDVTLLWWCRRSTDEKRGKIAFGTWEEFQKELKKMFYLQYAEKNAWVKLCQFTQQGTIRNGLKPWAKQELCQQGITELTVAMVKGESFVELSSRKDKFESSKPKETCNGGEEHEEDGNGNIKNNHMVRDYLKKCVLSAIKGDDRPDRASMRLAKRVKGKVMERNKNSTKKIKTVNFEVLVVGVAQGVELQIVQ
ncbi:hypothetical protein CXB51_034383 [Gossypium anomalum]|uniref:Retrotransposon gag domain-containing protein n=1 Tax=Gossypium anomalum TaxID=47600 RepID=A0A8J5Y1G1_9ROSI|nr:hypothetical protein CXB51_034383 [Gossypium anomalum]